MVSWLLLLQLPIHPFHRQRSRRFWFSYAFLYSNRRPYGTDGRTGKMHNAAYNGHTIWRKVIRLYFFCERITLQHVYTAFCQHRVVLNITSEKQSVPGTSVHALNACCCRERVIHCTMTVASDITQDTPRHDQWQYICHCYHTEAAASCM